MHPSDLLSIVVPTYNRADFIDFFLEVHIPVVEKYNIAIYISDNVSTDGTIDVLKKWEKRYSHLYWKVLEKPIIAVKNYEKALAMSVAEYTWLMGDSYEIPAETLARVIEILYGEKKPYQFVILNHAGHPSDLPEKVYIDENAVLEDLSWIMSCVSSNIFHRSVITEKAFQREKIYGRICAFCHVSYVLKYMAIQKGRLYWAQSASIETLKTRKRRYGWGNTFFGLVFVDWPLTIDSLPEQFTESSREVAKGLIAKSPILSWRRILTLRSQNALSHHIYSEYRDKIESMVPKSIGLLMRSFLLIPVPLSKVLIFCIEWIRRKHYQVGRVLGR